MEQDKAPQRGDCKMISDGTPNSTRVLVWDGQDWCPIRLVRSVSLTVKHNALDMKLEIIAPRLDVSAPMGAVVLEMIERSKAADDAEQKDPA